MNRKVWSIMVLFSVIFASCEEQDVMDVKEASKKVEVKQLPDAMKVVRDYVPENAVLAHRGTTYWAPEETEAAFRWARHMGADYLEADLQRTKDGVILALHDDNLKRTSDIKAVFSENFPEKDRRAYYKKYYGTASSELKSYLKEDGKDEVKDATLKLLTDEEIDSLIKWDKKDFLYGTYKPSSYTYEELMKLDCGDWFNKKHPERAKTWGKQFASTLEDLVRITRGEVIKLNDSDSNKRDYKVVPKYIKRHIDKDGKLVKIDVKLEYKFVYQKEKEKYPTSPETKNIPGIYIELKEPYLNGAGFEKLISKELIRLNMDITKDLGSYPLEQKDGHDVFYKDKSVNIGMTRGRTVLQTFSIQSMAKVNEMYQGQIPMCLLLWKGNGSSYMKDDSPEGYASFINLAIENNAHFTGPSIAGGDAKYHDLLLPWQADLTHRAGLRIHAYSFDTADQMKKYYGDYLFGTKKDVKPYTDAVFTNRSEISLQYLIEKKLRDKNAPQEVQDPEALLGKLGY